MIVSTNYQLSNILFSKNSYLLHFSSMDFEIKEPITRAKTGAPK